MRATALAAAAAMLSPLVTPMEHGWGCVLGCGGVSMLGGDFSTARFSLDDPWWLDVITASYGVVVVHELPVMAALKRRDPKIKTLLYQPIDRAGDSDLILRQLKAHSDWFVRDDEGRVVNFHGREGRPMPNYTIPDCQDWYANLAISLFPNRSVAALVLGGILLDGDGYHSYPNVSRPRAEALYQGMIQTTRKMQAAITALNGCGEVLINSGMWCDGPDNDTNASGPINQLACRSPVPMIDAASGSFDEVTSTHSPALPPYLAPTPAPDCPAISMNTDQGACPYGGRCLARSRRWRAHSVAQTPLGRGMSTRCGSASTPSSTPPMPGRWPSSTPSPDRLVRRSGAKECSRSVATPASAV
eukprot:SAG11_NODE_282_length_11247_cov_11.050323_11_plen_359_part_00